MQAGTKRYFAKGVEKDKVLVKIVLITVQFPYYINYVPSI